MDPSQSTMLSSTTAKSIAIITCSTRQPRVGPQIASFVHDTIKSSPHTTADSITLKSIDLTVWNLPLFNESGIPQAIQSASGYEHPLTQAWSSEISSHDAFIFVTPQYNWGYPASIKNAIDYLFNEWAHKAAMIVSYGGHGGDKAAGQLRQVLQAVNLRVADTMPGLTFGGRAEVKKAAVGADLDLTKWEGTKEAVVKAFEEVLQLLHDGVDSKDVGKMK